MGGNASLPLGDGRPWVLVSPIDLETAQ